MNGVSQQQDSLLEDNGETNGLSAMAMESEGFDRTIHMDFSKSAALNHPLGWIIVSHMTLVKWKN